MKKLYLGIGIVLSVLLLTVAAIAYQMLTVRSHINIVESQTLQYQDATGWHDFPINTGNIIDLGIANMKAGDSSTFYVQGINSNNRDVMYTLKIDSNYTELAYTTKCYLEGTQYTIIGGNSTFGQGLTVMIKNGAGLTSGLGITTLVNSGANITTGELNPITSISRTEVDSNITWTTCVNATAFAL